MLTNRLPEEKETTSKNGGQVSPRVNHYAPAYWLAMMSMHSSPSLVGPSILPSQFSFAPQIPATIYRNIKLTYKNSSSVNYLRFMWNGKNWVVSSSDIFNYVYPIKSNLRANVFRGAGIKLKKSDTLQFQNLMQGGGNQSNGSLTANKFFHFETYLNKKKDGQEKWKANITEVRNQLLQYAVVTDESKDPTKNVMANLKPGVQSGEIKQIELPYDTDIILSHNRKAVKKARAASSPSPSKIDVDREFDAEHKNKKEKRKVNVTEVHDQLHVSPVGSSGADESKDSTKIVSESCKPTPENEIKLQCDIVRKPVASSSSSSPLSASTAPMPVCSLSSPAKIMQQLSAPSLSLGHQRIGFLGFREPVNVDEESVFGAVTYADIPLEASLGLFNGISNPNPENPKISDWQVHQAPLSLTLGDDDEQNEEYSILGKRIREEDDADSYRKRQKL